MTRHRKRKHKKSRKKSKKIRADQEKQPKPSEVLTSQANLRTPSLGPMERSCNSLVAVTSSFFTRSSSLRRGSSFSITIPAGGPSAAKLGCGNLFSMRYELSSFVFFEMVSESLSRRDAEDVVGGIGAMGRVVVLLGGISLGSSTWSFPTVNVANN